MIQRVITLSRYIMVLPFIVTLLSAFMLIFYQCAVILSTMVSLAQEAELNQTRVKRIAVGLIEAVDVFLIGIAIYIISIGLYTLFIDDKTNLPSWLRLESLEDLKDNLVSVVIAVLAVLFLREAVAWEGGPGITAFGISCALVIAALVFFLRQKRKAER